MAGSGTQPREAIGVRTFRCKMSNGPKAGLWRDETPLGQIIRQRARSVFPVHSLQYFAQIFAVGGDCHQIGLGPGKKQLLGI